MRIKVRQLSLAIVALTFAVILLGAYTRLKDAGLGCPDWPGCYGHLLAPSHDSKAWIEMIHRYIASSLGLMIIWLNLISRSIIARLLLILVVFQGLLGMWTVTLGLYPIVVMAHLLGGFSTLALSWLLYLQLNPTAKYSLSGTAAARIANVSSITLIALIVQIALGAWTSANYAALVCADFPTCQGHWWPPLAWQQAFDFSAVGIFNSPGIPLENTARVTIQFAHRLGALFVAIIISILSCYIFNSGKRAWKILGALLLGLLLLQVSLGIANVLAHLPLVVSLMHNAVAALLLLFLITILFRSYAKINHTA